MKILIVDDDPVLALLAVEILRADGRQVLEPAHTADDALRAAAMQRPEFAFIDINLAGHDEGIALARRLTSEFGIHCVFLSGQVEAAHANRDAAIGLVKKPYRLEDLSSTLHFVEALVAGRNPPPPERPAKFEPFILC